MKHICGITARCQTNGCGIWVVKSTYEYQGKTYNESNESHNFSGIHIPFIVARDLNFEFAKGICRKNLISRDFKQW